MEHESKMAGFEAAITELEGILGTMMEDGTTLQQSVTLYARAAELIKQCTEGLDEARVQIEEIDTKMQALTEQEAEDDL